MYTRLTVLAALFALGSYNGNASLLTGSATGAQLSDGYCLQIGDKKVCDFAFSANIDPAAVNIAALETPELFPGIQITGPFTSGFNSSATDQLLVDMSLTYTVQTLSGAPLINGIGQAFNLTGTGDGGAVGIGETAFDGPGPFLPKFAENQMPGLTAQVAQSTVSFGLGPADFIDPPGEPAQGDDLVISPPLAKIFVTKDILLIANPMSSVSATIIIQRFSQVPEPGMYGMLALGLAGLWLVQTRRKRNTTARQQSVA